MSVENKIHLMTPGPVAVHPEILKSLARPMVHHLSLDFKKTLDRVLVQLKELFGTEQPVFIHTSTGSGAMESSVANILSPGDDVLVIVSGKFGERWAEICESYGLKTDRWNIPWGQVALPEQLRFKLSQKKYQAVLTQACESSTGVLHPIKEFGEVCREFSNTVLLVDGISSVGAVKLPMDAWGIDVLIAGSQKALMLPTGLAFIALSKKAWTKAQNAQLPKYYWDLLEEQKSLKKGRTRFSSAVTLIRALEVALDLILSQGLEHQLNLIEKKSLATRRAGEIFGLKIFAQVPSPSLTTFLLPQGISGDDVLKELEQKNIFLAGGQDHLAGQIIRIGHMGDITFEDVIYVLDNLFSVLLMRAPEQFKLENKELALKEARICLGF